MSKAMLNDLVRCIGCRSCQVACKQWNDTPAEVTRQTGTYSNPPSLSAKTWTLIDYREVEHDDQLAWSFAKRQCMHCEHPACVSACIVGALRKTPNGPVVYDDYKCIGCRYCMVACPFGIPTFEWDKTIPYIRKCTFCVDRLEMGMEPACAKACPTGAIVFGERDELIAEARARIKNNPDRYIDHVYGEKEAGGTSVLYVSGIPLEKLGFPALSSAPMSVFSDVAMAAVPPGIVVVTAAMGGIYWFAKRREKMAQLEVGEQEKEEV
jgi:formate dehydrogenase iron-sulfur subunit